MAAGPRVACSDLAELSPLLKVLSAKPTEQSSILEWSGFQQAKWDSLKGVARNVFASYRSGLWSADDSDALERCSAELASETEFAAALSSEFYSETVAILRGARSPRIKKLAEILDSREMLPFRIYGYLRKEELEGRKAGFHRGQRSIFLDFTMIPEGEWIIIFIHEVAHSLDEKLIQALPVYADAKLVHSFMQFVPNLQDPRKLPPEARRGLIRWLEAGLDRGFLAEWRAWTLTAQLYLDGQSEGLWQPIGWLENVLSGRKEDESIPTFLLHRLSPHFSDPSEGIFKTPLVSSELKRIRKAMADGRAKPELGGIGRLVE